MLKETILAALLTLIPTWSKSITESYKLPSEYYIVANMIFTDVIKYICGYITDSTVIAVGCALATWFLIKNYVHWTSIKFKLNRMWKKPKFSITSSDAIFAKTIERFVYNNQNLIVGSTEALYFDVDAVAPLAGVNYYRPQGYAYIKHPQYGVEFDCVLNSRTLEGRWIYDTTLQLCEGTKEDFQQFLSDIVAKYYYAGQQITSADNDCIVANHTMYTTHLETMDTFFHSDKEQLLHTVEWANKNKTTSSLGMVLYGPPGTGKTSFAQRVAKHLGRTLYVINLKDVTRRSEFIDIIMKPQFGHERFHPCDYVFVLDEFDKSLRNMNATKEMYKQWQDAMVKVTRVTDATTVTNVLDTKKLFGTDDEITRMNRLLTIDDLLSIIGGPVHAPGLIIMAMTNDFNYIKNECPALVRPGRFTPVLFDNGEPAIYSQIVKHYTGYELDSGILPATFRFQQSHVLEQVQIMKSHMTDEQIYKALSENWKKYDVAAKP